MDIPFPDSISVFAFEFQKQRNRQNLFHLSILLCPEFEALHSSILHRHPLPSLTEAVAEFTSEETRLQMMSSVSTPVQSISSPTALTLPYRPPTFRGLQNRESSFRRKMNRGQQPRGSSTQQVQCTFCKQLGHLIPTCHKRERLYGPWVPRSSVAASASAPASQSSVGFLSSDQFSQIASYLTQNLGITGTSSTSNFTAMSVISRDSTP